MPTPIVIKLPEGLKQFLDLVEEIDDVSLPKTVEEIIEHGQREACLAYKMTSAQQMYIYDILNDADFFEIVKLGFDKYYDKLKAFLKREQGKEDGKKRHAITLTLNDIDHVIQSILGVPEFVEREEMNVKKIKDLKGNHAGIMSLFNDICFNENKKIIGFGAVKAAIWLHSLGIGKDLPTPSGQVTWFIKTHFPHVTSTFRHDEDIPPQQVMWYAETYVNQMNKELSISCTNGKFSNAVWVWKNCRNLMLEHKNRLTPERLVDFMKSEKKNVDYLIDGILDIEDEDLGSDLSDFVS